MMMAVYRPVVGGLHKSDHIGLDFSTRPSKTQALLQNLRTGHKYIIRMITADEVKSIRNDNFAVNALPQLTPRRDIFNKHYRGIYTSHGGRKQ